jgi:hypothetical protein
MPEKLCYIVKSSKTDQQVWDWVRTELIETVAEKRGYRCEVGPPLGTIPHLIDRDIKKLIRADLVVVDATGCEDPQVFYQLGVRHARANHTILIAEDDESLAEDVASFYKIPYSSNAQHGFGGFRRRFAEVLDQLAAHPREPDNAVQKYLRGAGRVEEQAEAMREQEKRIAHLQEQIARLRQEIESNPPPPEPDERIDFKRVS